MPCYGPFLVVFLAWHHFLSQITYRADAKTASTLHLNILKISLVQVVERGDQHPEEKQKLSFQIPILYFYFFSLVYFAVNLFRV